MEVEYLPVWEQDTPSEDWPDHVLFRGQTSPMELVMVAMIALALLATSCGLGSVATSLWLSHEAEQVQVREPAAERGVSPPGRR